MGMWELFEIGTVSFRIVIDVFSLLAKILSRDPFI